MVVPPLSANGQLTPHSLRAAWPAGAVKGEGDGLLYISWRHPF